MFIVLELWFVSILFAFAFVFVFVNISREGDDYSRPREDQADGASHEMQAHGGVLAASRQGPHSVVFGRREL
jgi:uncharacterized membrane protein